jgi:hypothetical protein
MTWRVVICTYVSVELAVFFVRAIRAQYLDKPEDGNRNLLQNTDMFVINFMCVNLVKIIVLVPPCSVGATTAVGPGPPQLQCYYLKVHHPHCIYVCIRKKDISKSKHNCLYVVIFIPKLTTCFAPCAGPSSGHKLYKEEKLYSVSHKIRYIT